ncbi:MAG: methyltransferase domain-containing protein [Deltaproteobacteria bacterium]|nr:methyltransferase domain-containing protein [Deltaproteobacteria bacterium]
MSPDDKKSPHWYEEFFDDRYFAFFDELAQGRATAEADVEFIERALDLAAGARVIDVGCGYGRHTVPLAARGFQVTGIDLSERMLRAAEELSLSRQVAPVLLRRDMRELAGLGPFDACVCLYTVLGVFDQDAEDLRVLRAIRDVLVPGGRLLLDLSNPLGVSRHWPGDLWKETAIGIRRARTRYDPLTARVITEHSIYHPDGRREVLPTSAVRMYAPHEVAAMLREAGFVVDQLYGDLRDGAFRWNRSVRQAWVATREGA